MAMGDVKTLWTEAEHTLNQATELFERGNDALYIIGYSRCENSSVPVARRRLVAFPMVDSDLSEAPLV